MRTHSGFTFIELSMVLIVLGLLAGGILAGGAVVESAKIRAVTREVGDYMSAVNAFKQKYRAFPGDMSNASTVGIAYLGVAVPNGDGDGKIDWAVVSSNYEGSLAWFHLTGAELLADGMTSAIVSAQSNNCTPGTTVPQSTFNGGYAFDYSNLVNFGNHLLLGATTSAAPCNTGLLTTDQARQIDAKMDDGIPDAGIAQTISDGCTSGSAYDLSSASLCHIAFKIR